jgi:Tol biopolymer transport system component
VIDAFTSPAHHGDPVDILIGKTISHYRILEQIGAGGMGEVYCAHDLRLERDVALKVLPSGTIADEAVRRRFRREALALSKLNHPNIATVFDFDTQEGVDFLVMELVSGETLVGKLGRGPLPEGDVSRLGLELAEGLGAAHGHGVIHRDLKPGNVRLTPDGRLKILDFGLARLVRAVSDVASTEPMTEAQGAVGTLPYMSPEQLRGERVDARSDIWAAGAVLYEMATGRRAFPEVEAARVIAAILQEAPRPPRGVNGRVSAGLEGIILKCLEKDPGGRYQSAKELAAHLRRLSSVAGVRSIARSRLGLFLAAAVVGVFTLVAVVLLRTGTGPSRMAPPTWRQLTFIGNARMPTLSPDGKTIACFLPSGNAPSFLPSGDAPSSLMIQDIDGGRAIEIARDIDDMSTLRWSPTGDSLFFYGRMGSTWGSFLLHRMGGTPRLLPPWGRILALSPDGSTVAAAWPKSKSIELHAVIGTDSSSIPLAAKFTWFQDVEWAPDGKMLLFSVSDPSRYSIWTVRRDGTHQQKVYEDSTTVSCPRWAPQGGGIYCMRDLGRKREVVKIYVSADGGPSRRAPRVLVSEPELGSPFAVSRDGHRLVCTRTSGHSNIWLWPRSVRVGTNMAQPRQLTRGTALISDVILSPDGTRVAYLTNESGVQNVRVFSLGDSADAQLTFMRRDVMDCAWSPDGRHIAFTAQDGDTVRVWAVPARGGTPVAFRHSLVSESGDVAWSPGREILYQIPGNQNFNILDPVTGSERPLLSRDFALWMFSPAWSPDQEHVALTGGSQWLFVASTAGTVRNLRLPARRSLRWDNAGAGILAWVGNSIVRVSYPAFETTTVSSLARRNISALDFTPDLQTMVYTIDETNSDVWLVENFDPDVK